jgi:nucleoside-diphosphate-sugar epimerase
MEKKILILASTGFIGKNIKLYFENKKYNVFCLNRTDVDFKNKDLLNESIKNIDPEIVINCCGIVGSSMKNEMLNEFDILNDNVLLNINILDSCKNLNIKKIIMFSSYRIFGDNICEDYHEEMIQQNDIKYNIGYLTSKKILDTQIKLFMKFHKIDVICLILTNIYGKNDDFSVNSRIVPSLITKIKQSCQENTDIIINGNKNTLVNLVFIEDLSIIIESYIFNKNNHLSGNIIIFNKNGILSLEKIVNIICKIMNNKNTIKYTNEENISNSFIMKPNLEKFNKYFGDFQFHETEKTMELIIKSLE